MCRTGSGCPGRPTCRRTGCGWSCSPDGTAGRVTARVVDAVYRRPTAAQRAQARGGRGKGRAWGAGRSRGAARGRGRRGHQAGRAVADRKGAIVTHMWGRDRVWADVWSARGRCRRRCRRRTRPLRVRRTRGAGGDGPARGSGRRRVVCRRPLGARGKRGAVMVRHDADGVVLDDEAAAGASSVARPPERGAGAGACRARGHRSGDSARR